MVTTINLNYFSKQEILLTYLDHITFFNEKMTSKIIKTLLDCEKMYRLLQLG